MQVSKVGELVVFWILLESLWLAQTSQVWVAAKAEHPERAWTTQHLSGSGPYIHFLMLPVKIELIKNAQRKLPQLVFRILFVQGWDEVQHPQGSAQWKKWNEPGKLEHSRNSKIPHQTHLKQKLIALGIASQIAVIPSWLPDGSEEEDILPSTGDRQVVGLTACSCVDHRLASSVLPCLRNSHPLTRWGELNWVIFAQCWKERSCSFHKSWKNNRQRPWLSL